MQGKLPQAERRLRLGLQDLSHCERQAAVQSEESQLFEEEAGRSNGPLLTPAGCSHACTTVPGWSLLLTSPHQTWESRGIGGPISGGYAIPSIL